MIKLFAMDVDGTLTDGGIYMDGAGGEMKRFDVQDGQGIAQLLRKGVKVVFISGRFSAPTQRRAEDLKITRCVNGIKDKLPELEKSPQSSERARRRLHTPATTCPISTAYAGRASA